MSLKKFDLAKNLGLKIANQRKAAAIPGRFAADAAAVPDRREQRRLDAAAGLVPFACKLPAALVGTLRERAETHPEGVNGLVAELLQAGLSPAGSAAAPATEAAASIAAPAAKKAPRPRARKAAPDAA